MSYINKPLERSLNVTAYTRPIKIAYVVSSENTDKNNLILDAIFLQSYARWSGTSTLIIPSNYEEFEDEEYETWLAAFDPDYICTYIELSEEIIKKIAHYCNPSLFFHHDFSNETTNYKSFCIDWSQYYVEEPVSSISTVGKIKKRGWTTNRTNKIVITQVELYAQERFISDNFGTRYDLNQCLYPIEGLFDTYLFDFLNEYPNDWATKKSNSIVDILASIASNEATTFYQLANSCTNNLSTSSISAFNNSFQLFVGDSCLDRINFWNARHLTQNEPGSLIVSKSLFNDEIFITQLGLYLNKNNFSSDGRGPATVEIRSFSVDSKELQNIKDRLQERTLNHLSLPQKIDSFMLPNNKNYTVISSPKKHSYKLNEKENNNIAAQEPHHFQFIPVQFKYLCRGQLAIDLEIERTNNLSRITNNYDIWHLPRRKSASRCFKHNINRVTKHHLLSLILGSLSRDRNNSEIDLRYSLCIPTDKDFFYSLLSDNTSSLDSNDLRQQFRPTLYQDILISDKGQYLQGVISMFEHIDEAYESLTSKFWRDIIREKSGKNNITTTAITQKNMFAPLVKNTEHKKNVKDQMHLNNSTEVNKYVNTNFIDSLEYLVHKKIIFQLHDWKCEYCGFNNTLSIDNLKSKNFCEICNTTYELPIDFECKYKLNDFVVNALSRDNGMTVLWTLGFLHKTNIYRDFFYIPEVKLFSKEGTSVEIDIICIISGELYIGEVKRSAASFVNDDNEVTKFVEVIKKIQPDIALLSFEQYGDKPNDEPDIKEKLEATKHQIENCGIPIKVKILIATKDDPEFNRYSVSLYPPNGKRASLV